MHMYEAFNQWSTRNNDERFWNVDDALIAARHYKERAREEKVRLNQFRAIECDGQVMLSGPKRDTRLSHAGFDQVARYAGAPSGYLRTLPADIVATALNHGLAKTEREGNMLYHECDDGTWMTRCLTTEKYSRLWNYHFLLRLKELTDAGWKNPPARPARNDPRSRLATEADVLACCNAGIPVTVGMEIAPAGVYLSDHDFWVMLVYCDNPIDDGNGKPLYRALRVKNNEIGTGSVQIDGILFSGLCSNHIIMNMKKQFSFRFVHRKSVHEKTEDSLLDVTHSYVNESPKVLEDTIRNAREMVIAPDKDKLVAKLFERRIMAKSDITAAYEYAKSESHLHNTDPLTVWGFTQGMTKYSQSFPYADKRNEIDTAAQRLLGLTF